MNIKVCFQIVTLALLGLTLPRAINSVRVFFCGPEVGWDPQVSETDRKQILTCIEADDHRSMSPVTFSVSAFLEQFVGLEEYGNTIDIRRNGVGYVVLVDRGNDSADRDKWQYEMNSNYQIVKKTSIKVAMH
jgi:hypothetical protein